MPEKDRPQAAEKLTQAFGESYREVVRSAVDAQQRNVQLAQGWVEGVTGVLERQAEANRALTRAMEAHTNAVEEAIRSQERTSRALAESLEAYKDVIERNTALQEKSTDLVQGLFGDVTGELRQGMQSSQDVARILMEGSERQMEAFQAMLGEAMSSCSTPPSTSTGRTSKRSGSRDSRAGWGHPPGDEKLRVRRTVCKRARRASTPETLRYGT